MSLTISNQPRIAELRNSLYWVVESCVLDDCNDENCPFFWVRKSGAVELKGWLDILDEDELIYLTAYHRTCGRFL
jgi:hypothetical protein